MAAGWTKHGDGRTLAPGEVVRPDERLSWPRMVGFGAQHVVAMFGATFVFPLVMGLDPNVAIMFSGVGTIMFLLIVKGKVPSYLGTSASFVGGVLAIRALMGGDTPATDAIVTGAILVAGLVLALVGVAVHFLGVQVINRVFPPVVTGAVVMLIGFGLAYVVADIYWPQDQWMALITMTVTFVLIVLFKGFIGRIAILLGLIIGFVLSWAADKIFGNITAFNAGTGAIDTHPRVSFDAVASADWIGLPSMHFPDFKFSAVLLVLPAVIALVAENVGHVKAVGEMTKTDVDPYMGRAVIADGAATVVASTFGGSPTTTYAENIGVMAATRVYSTAAYYIAAVIAILFGLCPKFGALVAATPGGVLGGITVILYGMIGLLGAKIWIENRVDFADPVNLVPIGAGIILAIGPVKHMISSDFTLEGIALGTIVVVVGYHLLRAISGRGDTGGGAGPAEVSELRREATG
ncbi:nitrate reductase [Streptosporangium sp. NBC_01755]|uniref:uracil-xanthine permease family protein n=1 Tax=unclassified Streptosporangium TaxID=2632669 RepID=UPI002DD7B81E|nr:MULTISPECIES: solute carrier family 23 protein [unclassified Streptosporangium]WSA27550.1 nitrate reductase [Streptosporangium sp. NBC_01810]WSD00979.1 nitrate reductase [Streptosporangium sp. NBC_01755]